MCGYKHQAPKTRTQKTRTLQTLTQKTRTLQARTERQQGQSQDRDVGLMLQTFIFVISTLKHSV